MKRNKLVFVLATACIFTLASCASIKGVVHKQKDGNYKATYSAKTEREATRVVNDDAALTCKNNGNKTLSVVNEEIISLTEDTEKSGEGFSAVAGSAVSAVDKYFGGENVRATLTFDCV